ncbi:MAG: hypothetical protein AAF636_11490 [Pseudomonadota bacterium]
MTCPIHDEILDALRDRETWEKKQQLYYTMRHDGLPRKKPPYPGASNMHFPLIDTSIEKLKPFYYNQIFQTETLARFVAKTAEGKERASNAADWFDYKLKEETDFVRVVPQMVDYMLQRFRGILKGTYDPFKKKLCVSVIDPLYFIVPSNADTIEEADWFVHVQHMSVAAYKRNRRYNQSLDVIKKIRGGHDSVGDHSEDEKKRREGLTYTKDKSQIILWEVYHKTSNGYTVYTYAPDCPREDIRAAYALTTKWGDEVLCPFVDFPFELKDLGWYAPRGVAERIAPFEAALCKAWNAKHDHLDYSAKPLFTTAPGTDAAANSKKKIIPGEILHGVSKIPMDGPPISIDQEMVNTRMIAEQQISMPDVGIGNSLNTKEKKTAAEVNQIGALMGQGIEMRGGIFRNSMARFYLLMWALSVEYCREDRFYMKGEESAELDSDAFQKDYLVRPSGSPDAWNKEKRQQKARSRVQAYANHPNVNQEALIRLDIEADDPALVKELFVPSGQTEMKEQEDEALEMTGLLEKGFPALVLPHENHLLRIKIILGRLQLLDQTGQPINPIAQQRINEHMAQHLQYLQEQNPQAAKEVQAYIAQFNQQPQEMAIPA